MNRPGDVLQDAWEVVGRAVKGEQVAEWQLLAAEFVVRETLNVEGGPWLPTYEDE